MEKGKEVINEPFWTHPDGGKEITMAEKEYIEREALPQKRDRGLFLDVYFNDGWNACLHEIGNIPAADVREVKRGRWINQGTDSEICSACGSRFYISALFAVGINDEPDFCPNCGADMRERKEK